MERNERTIQDWLKAYDENKFNAKDVGTMCEAGWHDWFCKDESLHSRLVKMVSMVRAVAASPLLGTQPQYIFFKNNCPVNGHLYDSFSVCNMSDGQVQWWVCSKMGYDAFPHAAVYYHGRGFEFNLIKEYARIKYRELDLAKREEAVHFELNNGVRSIKSFFKNEDYTTKHRLIMNNIPEELKHNPIVFEV